MLKWTKRAEPSASNKTESKFSTLILAPQQRISHRIINRRSTGNLSRTVRIANRKKQRTSLGSSELNRNIQNHDKENRVVSTPHPNGFHHSITSTPVIAFGSKLDNALRDVRNITPKQNSNSNSIQTLLNAMTPSRKRPLAKTPPDSSKIDHVICSSPKESAMATNASVIMQNTPYASTLPTFDVEYSPCGPTQTLLITNPTSIIVTADSFFNQPRYFQEPLPASKRLKYSPVRTTSLASGINEMECIKLVKNPKKTNEISKTEKLNEEFTVQTKELLKETVNNLNNNNENDNNNHAECFNDANLIKLTMFNDTKPSKMHMPPTETSLSSSALNDTALDKMIDAILESARKERPSIVRNLAPRKVHLALMHMESESPTYKPAEDPAEDLNKFCDNFQISPNKLIGERTIILEEPNAINEREIRTPELDSAKRIKIDRAQKSNKSHTSNGCHLKRQRAVRRKHNFSQQKNRLEIFQSENNSIVEDMNATELQCLSPKTPSDSDFVVSSFFKKSTDELANMNTPTIDSNDSNVTYAQQPHCGTASLSDSTPCIRTNDLQASSTPTNIETVNAIRRCLTFSDSSSRCSSSAIDDSIEKPKSTTSSTNSIASMSNSSHSTRMMNLISASLDLSLFIENNKIHINGELV